MAIGLGQFKRLIVSIILLFPISSEARLELAGQRWAIERDHESRITAVYDLSYPSFLTQISLGLITPEAFDYDAVKRKVDEAVGGDSLSAQSATAFQSQRKMDWGSIPWKNKKRKLLSIQGEMTSFKLNDIDFDQAVTNKNRFNQLVSEANDRYKKLDVGKNSDLLSAFEFRKVSNGDFELFWQPSSQDSQPLGRKIADLTSLRAGFYEMLELSALRAALGTATGLIPVPLVSALIGTAVDRFFYYYNQLHQSHQEMFLEMLAAAEKDGNSFSPFKQLMTQTERNQAASYIVLENASPLEIIKNIFFPRDPSDRWLEQLNKYETHSGLAIQWLISHQMDYRNLGPRFAVGLENSQDRYLYLSSRSIPRKMAGPYVGYDELNPDAIVLRRLGEALLSLEVSFVANSMSFVGTGIQQVYNWTVESEIENSKYAESRLLATLEQRQAEMGEDWSRVLEKLPAQQANPMELSWDDQMKLLQARKQKVFEN